VDFPAKNCKIMEEGKKIENTTKEIQKNSKN